MMLVLAQEAQANSNYIVWGFILLAIAVVLLFIELLVPSGGLIGALCAVAVIGSIIAFFRYDTTWGVVSALSYLILAPIVLVLVFKVWLHSPLGRRMILGTDVSGRTSSIGDEEGGAARADQARRERLAQLQELIGAEGKTVTALRPVGVVKIGDQRVDALAESGVIEADTPVTVTDVYDNQIKVRAADA